jgi:hypothetical protein
MAILNLFVVKMRTRGTWYSITLDQSEVVIHSVYIWHSVCALNHIKMSIDISIQV